MSREPNLRSVAGLERLSSITWDFEVRYMLLFFLSFRCDAHMLMDIYIELIER